MRHGLLYYTDDMDAYLLLEQAFCDCEAGCVCGWDDEEED